MRKFGFLFIVFALVLSACNSGGNTKGESAGKTESGGKDGKVELQFYFPVAVGGPITKLIDQLASDFEKENENIDITPIYGGSYQDTMTKVATAVQGNNSPDIAVLLSTDLYTLLSMLQQPSMAVMYRYGSWILRPRKSITPDLASCRCPRGSSMWMVSCTFN